MKKINFTTVALILVTASTTTCLAANKYSNVQLCQVVYQSYDEIFKTLIAGARPIQTEGIIRQLTFSIDD